MLPRGRDYSPDRTRLCAEPGLAAVDTLARKAAPPSDCRGACHHCCAVWHPRRLRPTTVCVLFFLPIAGGIFLRRLVEILPRFKDKRQAVHISQQVEADISAYLTTITVINLGVGVATGIVTAACGVGDPVLWGTVAFLLNYVPILGPLIGVTTLVFAGLLSISTLWLAFVPAGVYVLIHVVEGESCCHCRAWRRGLSPPQCSAG